MKKYSIAILALLFASIFIIFKLPMGSVNTTTQTFNEPNTEVAWSDILNNKNRVEALENKLILEIERREKLENRVGLLLEHQNIAAVVPVSGENENVAPSLLKEQERRHRMMRDWLDQQSRSPQGSNQLARAGFTPEQVTWIAQREDEISLQTLDKIWHRRHQAYLDGSLENPLSNSLLQSDLGEEAFKRYLQAKGHSLGVSVKQLLNGSLAEHAGLQLGDEIIAYNNNPIFGDRQLSYETARGEIGELVDIEILRNGERLHLSIERGPLGAILNDKPNRRRFPE